MSHLSPERIAALAQAAYGETLEIAFADSEGWDTHVVQGAAQGHPLVLDLRWQLAAHGLQWEAALDIARPDVVKLESKAEGQKRNVLLATLLRDGMKVLRSSLVGHPCVSTEK